jgi:DNA-directed RNA polymerase subunit RPC12/RpoP
MPALLQYKCPACGGAIEFDSTAQRMKCPYCDTEFDLKTLEDYDNQLHGGVQDDMAWNQEKRNQWQAEDGSAVYVCQSCGGEIIAEETTAAASCPYCSNPVVMTHRLTGELRPDFIIPFQLNKQQAKNAYQNYLKGKRLLPKVFKEENHIDEIKGLYVPFWLFNADADAHIRYKATKIRTWSDQNYDYTQTQFYSVIREGGIGFQRVPVDGSSKMPNDLMESLEPYDFSKAVDFQTAYLAGYLADKYDVSDTESIPRANERIRKSTIDTFATTVRGYHTVTPEENNIHLANGKTSYAFYPVWILNTTWEGQKYIFAMNGQTGKFIGNLPVDTKAYWRWLVTLTALIGAVIYGIIWLGWLL